VFGTTIDDYPRLGAEALGAAERLHASAVAIQQAVGKDGPVDLRLLAALASFHDAGSWRQTISLTSTPPGMKRAFMRRAARLRAAFGYGAKSSRW